MTITPLNAENTFLATVTVANGAAGLSEVINTKGLAIVGLVIGAWTTAYVGLQVSVDGTNFVLLSDSSKAPIKCDVAANSMVNLPFPDLHWPYMKVASINSSGVAVDQTAARTVQLLLRKTLS